MLKRESYFLKLSEKDVEGVTYALLPGDPERSKDLAYALDENPKLLQCNRHHLSYLVTIDTVKVLITSTGMGGPAIPATVLELYSLGIRNFLRIGTCGTIKESVNLGDLVISTAAIKFDGMSQSYLEESFPAIPSFSFTQSLEQAAIINNVPHHTGLTVSSDTFWPGQERYDSYSGYVITALRGNIDMWRNLNVTNLEMEGAALFSICSFLKCRSA